MPLWWLERKNQLHFALRMWSSHLRGRCYFITILIYMNSNKNLTEMVAVDGNRFAVEIINGRRMINATQMAKPFNRKPLDWLKTQQAKDLQQALSVVTKINTADLQIVRQGGVNQGTWLHEDLALLFAQWLSPKFYLACNNKLKELLTKHQPQLTPLYGVSPTVIDGKVLYSYHAALQAIGASTRSGSTSRRKALYPHQFVKAFGRNFITAEYFGYLKKCHEVHQLQISFRNEGGLNLW